MQNTTVNLIQYYFNRLTNSKISQKEAEEHILPLINFINNGKNNKFLLSGPQGSGKTTLLKLIAIVLEKKFNKKILQLSLDDFYYDNKKRTKLSKNVHLLLKTRGVPGTHDIVKLLQTLKKFDKSKYPIDIPTFNKFSDLREKIIKINKKCDLLILEGWCVGAQPVSKSYLFSNINQIEKKFDSKGIWRRYYNDQLKNAYAKLFKQFDSIIYIKPPSFDNVLNWRIKQERVLRKKNKNSKIKGMSNRDIVNFIQYYEKITKWMLKTLPHNANLVLYINNKQKIYKIRFNK